MADSIKLTGLWKRTSKDGTKTFWSGDITAESLREIAVNCPQGHVVSITLFHNDKAEGNYPNYQLSARYYQKGPKPGAGVKLPEDLNQKNKDGEELPF